MSAVTEVKLTDLARRVAEQARTGEQVEAYVARGTSTSIKTYAGDVESLTQAGSAGIGIRVVSEGRTGFAWAASLEDDIVAETLAEARDNLPFAEPDEHAGLAEPDGVEPVVHDLFRAGVEDTPTADKVAMALELERVVLAADPRVASVFNAVYNDSAGEFALASSTGIVADGRSTLAYLTVAALAEDGDASVIGSGLSVGREPGDLSISEAADDAVERTLAKIGAIKPESGEVTLVLEPRLTATLMGIIAGMLNGEVVAKRRSPFVGRLGDQIAASILTIVDDPTNPESFGADSHDDEGLACRRLPVLEQGSLQSFFHNSVSARKLGTTSTASAVRGFSSRPGIGARALAVAPVDGDLDSFVGAVDDGILVESFKGLHSGVNPVSGDFSVGIEGTRLRGGARAEAVKEATVASTLQRLLLDVSHVGADLEWQPDGSGGVSLVIPGVTMSGR